MAVLAAVSVLPSGAFAATQDITITSKENKVPTYQAGKTQKWTITVTNRTSEELENVVLGPQLGDKNDDWPFKTEVQDYQQELGALKAGKSADVTFEFTQSISDIQKGWEGNADRNITEILCKYDCKAGRKERDYKNGRKRYPERDVRRRCTGGSGRIQQWRCLLQWRRRSIRRRFGSKSHRNGIYDGSCRSKGRHELQAYDPSEKHIKNHQSTQYVI